MSGLEVGIGGGTSTNTPDEWLDEAAMFLSSAKGQLRWA